MRVIQKPRHAGKTQAIVEAAIADPEAIVVCATMADAKRVVARGVPGKQVKPGTEVRGMGPTQLLIDDVDRIGQSARQFLRYWANRVPVLATATAEPKPEQAEWPEDLFVKTPVSPLTIVRAVLDQEGLSPENVMQWFDPARQTTYVDVRWSDGSGSKQLVTREKQDRAKEPELLWLEVGRRFARSRRRFLEIDEIDAVECAVRLIGFERHEVKAASLRREDDGTVMLDVDVFGTEWEPSFELDHDDVKTMRQLTRPLAGLYDSEWAVADRVAYRAGLRKPGCTGVLHSSW